MAVDHTELAKKFRDAFLEEPRVFHAPGRVNLIGEHTDYNDGFVLPIAIDRGASVAAAPRSDRLVRVQSLNLGDIREFDLDAPAEPRRGIWLDYVEGVARALESRGVPVGGANLLIESDVPVGSGLSSSAALEVSSGLAIWSLSGGDVDRVTLALSGQQAEHEFVGAMVGIMDQLISALGRAGHALLIDCRSLETRPIRVALPGVSFVVLDSRVKHNLAGSEYNTRREETGAAAAVLCEGAHDCRALRDVDVAALERAEGRLDATVYRRARHVVAENARTLEAARALEAGDAAGFGRLMSESHASLRDDYEVSCSELDTLVDLAVRGGALGARMTGGGFGGCTVNLVPSERIDAFVEDVSRGYHERAGLEPLVYVVSPSDGARELGR